jgi:hypothetical protein
LRWHWAPDKISGSCRFADYFRFPGYSRPLLIRRRPPFLDLFVIDDNRRAPIEIEETPAGHAPANLVLAVGGRHNAALPILQ